MQKQHKHYIEVEKEKERERERERLHREREREKAAAQVSSKKKVEQRISTMTEAQIMEKLRMYFVFYLLSISSVCLLNFYIRLCCFQR